MLCSGTNRNCAQENYEELLREIYKSPKITLPKLGEKPSFVTGGDEKVSDEILPPIEHPKSNSKIDKIKTIAPQLTNSSYEERKKKAAEIYEIALNAPLGEIINLINDKDLNVSVAAAIALKSITQNHSIDLGTNPNVRQFVVSNLNSKSSFLRYRIFDYISVSETLQKDFKNEIEKQLDNENNEEVLSKINSILGRKPVVNETNKQRIKTELQSLLMNNQVNKALKILRENTQDRGDDFSNSIILISAQFAKLEREMIMGTISYSDVNLQRNRLINNLINIINEI